MEPPVPGTETVVEWQAGPLKLGRHATREIGADVAALGVRHALVVTDRGVAATGLAGRVAAWLEQAGVTATVFDGAHVEPTDESVAAAAAELRAVDFDGVVAVGGGSAIDTAKAIVLLTAYPAEPLEYVGPPLGAGRSVPGPLAPLAAVPTTAGTGSECSPVCVLDFLGPRVKAGIADPRLRPRLALVDPLNTITMPAAVTAVSGYDVLAQALESYTARPYDVRPRASGGRRGGYVGANPISDLWAEKVLELVGRAFRRVVADPSDVEARVAMCEASTFARFSNAGAHVPHALGYPIAGLVRGDYRPPGYDVDGPLVPHGASVIVTTPAVYEWTYDACPERHLRAAELLGASLAGVTAATGRDVLPALLLDTIRATGGPRGIAEFGYGDRDVRAIVDGALLQERLLVGSPLPAGREELERIVRASLAY